VIYQPKKTLAPRYSAELLQVRTIFGENEPERSANPEWAAPVVTAVMQVQNLRANLALETLRY
jgi:hypothetical protein